jgi:hypothetical protein
MLRTPSGAIDTPGVGGGGIGVTGIDVDVGTTAIELTGSGVNVLVTGIVFTGIGPSVLMGVGSGV